MISKKERDAIVSQSQQLREQDYCMRQLTKERLEVLYQVDAIIEASGIMCSYHRICVKSWIEGEKHSLQQYSDMAEVDETLTEYPLLTKIKEIAKKSNDAIARGECDFQKATQDTPQQAQLALS